MTLSQLRFAKAVASSGSFTAAAAACSVTQPTLSNGIAELESALGQRLFVRTTRRVALTEFGEQVLPAIADVLAAHEALLLRARAQSQPNKRLIRIGTSPLISPSFLSAIVEPFQQRNPNVDLIYREMNLDDLYAMLEGGALDFVFGAVGVGKATGCARKWARAALYREPLRFIPSGGEWDGLQRKHSVRFEDIARETFVMVPNSCGLAQATRALFRAHRRTLREYSGQALSYQVLEQWAQLGIGAAILPKSKLGAEAALSFEIIDKDGRVAAIEFEAAWASAEPSAAPLAGFAEHLRETVPALVAGLAV